jgi:hypothetical protein
MRWRADPVAYAIHRLGIVPTAQQCQLLEAIAPAGAKVSCRSGHGVGKSTALAITIFWFLECFDYPKIPCTAPTSSGLRDVLWAELSKLMRLSAETSRRRDLASFLFLDSLFRITQDRLVDRGAPEWFAVARTASKERADALQGFHALDLLFIVDEASGVPDEIFQAAEGALSTPGSRLLLAGNPLRHSGFFAASHKENRSEFTSLHFRSQDSPLVATDYRAKLVRKFGEGNVVKVRCDGDFPSQDDDTLIALEDCELALKRPPGDPAGAKRILGLDVARYGSDRTVFLLRQGPNVEQIEVRSKQSLMETCGQAIHFRRLWNADAIHVDEIGVGAGVCDRLKELEEPVVGVNVADAAPEPPKKHAQRQALPCKMRDWIWLEMARFMREDEPSFASAAQDHAADLAGELCSLTYKHDSSGRIVAESKDDMKKRKLRSPDIADALGVTFAPAKRKATMRIGTVRGAS